MNPDEVIEIQRRLQAKGLYTGKIDGEIGPATQRAIVLEQQMTPKKTDAEIELERDKLRATQAEKDAALQQQREENASPLWNTTIPAGIGALGGAGIGELENQILHRFNKGNAEAIKGIAKELGPVENLTNSQLNRSRAAGAATAAEKYMPSSLRTRSARSSRTSTPAPTGFSRRPRPTGRRAASVARSSRPARPSSGTAATRASVRRTSR
jgi:hypothetical protein